MLEGFALEVSSVRLLEAFAVEVGWVELLQPLQTIIRQEIASRLPTELALRLCNCTPCAFSCRCRSRTSVNEACSLRRHLNELLGEFHFPAVRIALAPKSS